ncbi:MAG: 30S ribosomal protein S20 [Clostridia bacterium]|nr:30S ribosomal protein S20 [Clostridia bacterium]
MPNIKSAKKRVLVNNRKRNENRPLKSELSTAIRKFREALATDVEKANAIFAETVSVIDSAVAHGIITKNSANNKKSRLAIALNKANNTVAE